MKEKATAQKENTTGMGKGEKVTYIYIDVCVYIYLHTQKIDNSSNLLVHHKQKFLFFFSF